MSNHPNRSRSGSPAKEEVRAARKSAGLTQTAAAALLHTTCRVWQQWEAGDRRMHPAFWELFLIKKSDKSKYDAEKGFCMDLGHPLDCVMDDGSYKSCPIAENLHKKRLTKESCERYKKQPSE